MEDVMPAIDMAKWRAVQNADAYECVTCGTIANGMESGPGIATMPRPCVDNEQWGCTLEDLVAGDA